MARCVLATEGYALYERQMKGVHVQWERRISDRQAIAMASLQPSFYVRELWMQ